MKIESVKILTTVTLEEKEVIYILSMMANCMGGPGEREIMEAYCNFGEEDVLAEELSNIFWGLCNTLNDDAKGRIDSPDDLDAVFIPPYKPDLAVE